MEPPLVDGVFLVTLPPDDFPIVLSSFPPSCPLHLDSDAQFLASVRPSLPSSDSIYTFNTSTHFFYSLYFHAGLASYTIAVASRHPFAAFFHDFIAKVLHEFASNPDCASDPYNRFSFMCSIVGPWIGRPCPERLLVSLPTIEYDWLFQTEDTTFDSFDPLRFFLKSDLADLWDCLFTGKPILVLCADTKRTAEAIFAAMSLLSPLAFVQPICLWLTVTDPRFVDIVVGESELAIAGSDCGNLEKNVDYFRRVFRVRDIVGQDGEVVGKLRMRMRRSLGVAKYWLDNSLVYDMYYDVLERSLCPPDLEEELRQYRKYDLPNSDQFRMWETTLSFRKWRKERDCGPQFRDALLSSSPDELFRGKTNEQLLVIRNKIKELRRQFARDQHVLCVLKRHSAILHRMLAQEGTDG
jgi:hypothetical protein